MEALQMLKFFLKKEWLNFTEGWMMTEKAMMEDDPDDDLLSKLLDPAVQDDMDHVILQAINAYED